MALVSAITRSVVFSYIKIFSIRRTERRAAWYREVSDEGEGVSIVAR